MQTSIEKAILPIKINELVQLISKKKRIGITDAVGYLYNSTFYARLSNPEAKWWYMSGINLFRELEKEKKSKLKFGKKSDQETQFIIFCTENYRITRQLEGSEVVALFQKYQVYDFLTQNYEILHTQGEQYILEEIEIFIKNQQNKWSCITVHLFWSGFFSFTGSDECFKICECTKFYTIKYYNICKQISISKILLKPTLPVVR